MSKTWVQIIVAVGLLIGVAGAVIITANAVTVTTTKAGYEACLDGAAADHLPLDGCLKTETLWDRGLSDPMAFYTLWLTFFTLALAVGGLAQSFLIGQQIRLSREEFVATHRPKMIVHSVEFLTVNSPNSQRVGADITIFNVGDTLAENIVISGKIFDISGRPQPGLKLPEIERHPESNPGTQNQISISLASDTPLISHEVTRRLSANDGAKEYVTNLRCIGTIAYSDRNKVRRVTGFCWRLKDDRWVRQSKSAYEYSY